MKQFTMRDESFTCEYCNKNVLPLYYSARDHCPFCLYSKHVDHLPGDRLNACHGLLEPIGIEPFKQSYKIMYRCLTCHQLHKNIMASDDDMDQIIALSSAK